MTLPDRIRDGVDSALAELRLGALRSATPVSGGCINHGSRIDTSTGASIFLKWRTDAPAGMYDAEAAGLEALRNAAGGDTDPPPRLRIPGVIAVDPQGTWLALEFVAEGRRREPSDEALGRTLAHMHRRTSVGPDFGWETDNWIGTLPQENPACSSWGAFWRDARLAPQLELARADGYFATDPSTERVMESVLAVTEPALDDITGACLVHGDLWGGNAYADTDGRPVLIDPAVYRGHGEVDLAMSELFGGFGPRFYEAYDAALEITDEYAAYRRHLYQLYYLLVHVNLFGGGYVQPSLRAAERVLAALS